MNASHIACFYHYHNTSFFGLAKNDHKLLGKRNCDFEFPTQEATLDHRKEIKKILHPVVVPPTAPLPWTPETAPGTTTTTSPTATPAATACVRWRNGELYVQM